MTGPLLRLMPGLEPAAYTQAYARDGVVQISPLFEPETAEQVALILEKTVPWDLFYFGADGQDHVLEQAQVAALGREAVAGRMREAQACAREGFAYLYLGYQMITAYVKGRDPGHPLHQLTEFLNSPEFLDFVRAVTGEQTVLKVDAQATFYRPGDFLNLHDDSGVGERRAAYTLGVTRRWRPDWGGQLLFHAEDGEITRGLPPGFNVLTLFKVPQAHSVPPVANYAGGPRFSITGWLRDDPGA